MMQVEFQFNDERAICDIAGHETLLAVLRDKLGAMEVKYGCGEGACGSCVVLVDGNPLASCITLCASVDGTDIMSVKAPDPPGAWALLKDRFAAHEGAQCGFCTPGLLASCFALVQRGEKLTRQEIREALSGHLCRCTGYHHIVDAVEEAMAIWPTMS
ncbi:MAG: 2Fe-2S iron-sulfur cluster-binding protein [Firmicutes bacterium]|jgi:carbon-monoxide dehydrogenase small subunit|nr:2Fe-2S iron-sulfur cluster-binding protein [Bacillota bacterium]